MTSVDVTTEGRSAAEILAWSRTVFDPALRDAVDSLPASMRHIAGYHLGWWDADGVPAQANGGKAIRPALALLSAEAVGGTATDAVPAAVAVELVHNFSLLHDDVIDRDETRRHRPTAWAAFGLGNAILAGDALLTLAVDVVVAQEGAGSTTAKEQVKSLGDTVQALIDGQFADVSFESRSDVSLEECVHMAENKTGALLSCSCAVGAMAGGGSALQVDHLTQFGARLGLAFQVADDIQGIWGDPKVTGKPLHSDLRNRKKSLPVVAALQSPSRAAEELARWLASDQEPTAPDLLRAAELVDQAGGRLWSQSQLAALQTEALSHLQPAGSTAHASAELRAMARLVTGA
jgi:geranylgeranyl diphosphate synthase, type I